MTNPAVSIVISMPNRSHFLKETVTSVLAQTFANWELIIIDNASGDESDVLLNELRDARVRKLCLEQQAEYVVARNKGLAATNGEFVLFLDDDLLMEAALQTHLDVLAKYREAVASIAGGVEFDGSGRRKTYKLVRQLEQRNLWPDIMFGWMPHSAGQCLFRRSALRKINGWSEDAVDPVLAEHHLWLRLARLGPAVLLPEVLCKQRRLAGPGQPYSLQLGKPMTKLRKRAAQELDGQDYDHARKILEARENFRLAMSHYEEGNAIKSLRFCLAARRLAPELMRSPLMRPLLLAPMLKSLSGTPKFSAWIRRLSKQTDIPLRHVVTPRSELKIRMNGKTPDRPNAVSVSFIDRCKLLGLEHELKWFWVKTAAAKQWRQFAGQYQWIFILGCNNSGTTLMTRILEAHPDISGVPRGGRGATVALFSPRRVEAVRLWTEKVEQFRLTEADQHLDALRLVYDWVAAVRPLSRPYVLEKAPPDMICSRWFQEVFPNARFIGLVRNGYAVAEGMNRREGYSLDRCARHWNTANKIMLDDVAHLQRFQLVHYEDITRDPGTVMRQICQFLGIDSRPLQAVIAQEWKVHNMDNAAAKIQDFNGRSLARLSPRDIETINRHAGEMLARFGYAIQETFAVDPSGSERLVPEGTTTKVYSTTI